MPQAERYEPTGDLHIFDGGEDELPEEAEGASFKLLLLLALVVFAAFFGVVYLAYTQGVKQGRDEAPRPVASSQPTPKVGANDYKNFNVYKPAPSEDELANEDAAPPPPTSITPAKPATTPAPTKPSTLFPLAPAPSASKPTTLGAAAPPPAASLMKSTAPQTAPVAAKPVPTPLKPVAAATASTRQTAPASTKPAVSTASTKQIAPAAQKPSSITTASKAPATTSLATAGPKQIVPQTAAPTPAKPAPAKPETTVASVAPPPQALAPTPAPVATAPAPAKSTGGYVLQIGAYKSDAEARDSWRAYKSAHAAAAGYEPDIIKVDIPGKGTWYRLRVGSFASTADASVLCDKLKASGGSCFPAKR